ncbi:MAG: squalene synthase HpnC [Candidatus Bipolaricaulia bacterium]
MKQERIGGTVHRERTSLDAAYAYCERLAKTHYENFTIGSWFLPQRIKKHLYAIYGFSRFVDDLGDEAPGGPEDRLMLLDLWEAELKRCYEGTPEHIIMIALQDTIRRFSIPPDPFLKLIEANRIDQRISRYPTFEDLLYYCDHSANPVGHLVLYLFGYSDAERQQLSDHTCTALQLTNFWQDIARDLDRDRIYLPLEDMERFDCSEAMLRRGRVDERFAALLTFEIERTWDMFAEGLKLVDRVDRRLRRDLKLFTLGGMKVLDAIERCDYDVFNRRPTLSRWRKAGLMIRMAFGRIGG